MATGLPLASILVSPSSGYQFTNANVGDLLIQGINGGSSQKILLGTQSNAEALVTFHPLGVSMSAPLSVMGATTLSNSLTVYGPLYVPNNMVTSGEATILGKTTLSNNLMVYGRTVLSNTTLMVGDTTTMGAASFSNNVSMASNLSVKGPTALQNSLLVLGSSTFSNAIGAFHPVTLYNAKSTLTMSNSTGSAVLSAASNNFGVNTGVGSNPNFALDVNGDINFTGDIFRNGSIFSGWNSNAFGNYINSNAAFGGKSTSNDGLLLYTTSSNLSFTMINTDGHTSFFSIGSNLGVGIHNPSSTLDVGGEVYARSNIIVDGRLGVSTHSPKASVDVQSSVDGVSVNCTAKVIASEFVVYSDLRIKTNVSDFDGNTSVSAGDIIDLLVVREFNYIDSAEKGDQSVIGFVAQEVEAVFPPCVATCVGYIPDIFKTFALSSTEYWRTKSIFQVELGPDSVSPESMDRIVIGGSLKCKNRASDGNVIFAEVIGKEGTLITLRLPDLATGEDSIFIVGTLVSDLKMLRHDTINAIAVSAIKGQNQKIRYLEERIDALIASSASASSN